MVTMKRCDVCGKEMEDGYGRLRFYSSRLDLSIEDTCRECFLEIADRIKQYAIERRESRATVVV